jgi:hypothetical protein
MHIYEKGVNSLMSKDFTELVCGNPEQVIPIFLVTIKLNTTDKVSELYFLSKNIMYEKGNSRFERGFEAREDEKKKVREELLKKNNKVILACFEDRSKDQELVKIDLGKQYFLMKLPKYRLFAASVIKNNNIVRKETKLQSYIVYSADVFSSEKGGMYFESIINFAKSLKSSMNGFYYGNNITNCNTVHKTFVTNYEGNDNFDHIIMALRKIFDSILAKKSRANIIYLFLRKYNEHENSKKITEDFMKEYLIDDYFITMRIIFFDKPSSNILKIKYKYENTKYYEENYFIESPMDEIPCELLLEQELEINEIISYDTHHLLNYEENIDITTPFPHGVISEGFINNIELQPVWDTKTFGKYLLYKGTNNNFFVSDVPNKCKIRDFNEDDLTILFDELVFVLCRFRNYLITNPSEHRKTFTDLENIIDICLNLNNYVITEHKNFKLSRKIKHIINKLVSDITSYSSVKFNDEKLKKLMSMKYGKRILSRSSAKESTQIFDINKIKMQSQIELNINEKSCKVIEPIDALYYNNKEGYLIETEKSSSSEINPWNIIVKYVSDEKMKLDELFTKTENLEKITDKYGKVVTDILITNTDYSANINQNDIIKKLYYGYLFTGIPECYIPGQELALMTNTFSSLLEKILKKSMSKIYYKREDITHEELSKYVDTANKMKQMLTIKIIDNEEIISLAKKLQTNDSMEMDYLISTHNNIISLNKILLCFMVDDTLVNNKILIKSLIKECVRKNARVLLARVQNRDSAHYELLTKLYEIDIRDYNFDIKKIATKTNRFFMKQYTNCSLFTLISAYNYFKNIKELQETVVSLYYNNDINMMNTLKDIVDFKSLTFKAKTNNIQLALYTYGIKNCYSNKIDDFNFENSEVYINTEIQSLINKVTNDAKILANKKYKINDNELKRIQESEIYKGYHRKVKIFNHEEVVELNKDRPDNDKLWLMKNGLLVHHCCCTECPYYLKKFYSKLDEHNDLVGNGGIAYGSRLGLMNHFKYDMWNNTYIKSFHKTAKTFYRKNYDDYVKEMHNYYENDDRYRNAFHRYEYIEELLLDTYNAYNKK